MLLFGLFSLILPCTKPEEHYFGFILLHHHCSYLRSVPALTANREEPVTGFIGHCLGGCEYLGLEIEFFSALFPESQKMMLCHFVMSTESRPYKALPHIKQHTYHWERGLRQALRNLLPFFCLHSSGDTHCVGAPNVGAEQGSRAGGRNSHGHPSAPFSEDCASKL